MTIINDSFKVPSLISVQAPTNTMRVAEFLLGNLLAGESNDMVKYAQKMPCLINRPIAKFSSH